MKKSDPPRVAQKHDALYGTERHGTVQVVLSLPCQRGEHTAAMNSTASNLITGTLPPPPGVIPNFTNPQSIGYRLIIAAVIFPAIALIFLSLRIYTKRWILKQLLLDDCKLSPVLVRGFNRLEETNRVPRLDHPCICMKPPSLLTTGLLPKANIRMPIEDICPFIFKFPNSS